MSRIVTLDLTGWWPALTPEAQQKAVRALERPVTLPEIKDDATLRESALIKVGRLSVVPITATEWEVVLGMSRAR